MTRFKRSTGSILSVIAILGAILGGIFVSGTHGYAFASGCENSVGSSASPDQHFSAPLNIDALARKRVAGKVIVLVGPPAAGKGTQSAILKERLGLLHISGGDLFRNEVQKGTKLGRSLDAYMKAGKLVPGEVLIAIMTKRLSEPDAANGFILDGTPRSVEQLGDVEKMLAALGKRIDFVININISEEEAVRRLAGRRVCPGCRAIYNVSSKPPVEPGICDTCHTQLVERADDRAETIRERFRSYRIETEPLLAELRQRGIVYSIEGGELSPEALAETITRILAGPIPERD